MNAKSWGIQCYRPTNQSMYTPDWAVLLIRHINLFTGIPQWRKVLVALSFLGHANIYNVLVSPAHRATAMEAFLVNKHSPRFLLTRWKSVAAHFFWRAQTSVCSTWWSKSTWIMTALMDDWIVSRVSIDGDWELPLLLLHLFWNSHRMTFTIWRLKTPVPLKVRKDRILLRNGYSKKNEATHLFLPSKLPMN